MSEGLLKRKFRQVFETFSDADIEFLREEDFKIIDEAKKEFEALVKTAPDLNDYFEEEGKAVTDHYVERFKKLVKKWFGLSYEICGNESPQYKILCTEPAGHKGNHKGNSFVWADASGIILGEDEDRKLKGETP